MIKLDSEFLKSHFLMDYSLLLVIEHIENLNRQNARPSRSKLQVQNEIYVQRSKEPIEC